MDEFNKYLNTIIRASMKSARSAQKRYSEEYNQAFVNHILNLDGPTALKRNLSNKDVVISKLFYGFNEIHKSYERLKEHEVYVGRFPYSGTEISKVSHLNYNIENYLGEFYILKERIKKYLATVGRIYKKDSRHSDILKYTQLMFKVIPTVFDGLIKARGAHVHEARYTDKDFERLSTIELLVNHGKEESRELEIIYDIEYKELRSKWKNIIKDKNRTLLDALNLIFKNLHPHVFTRSGNIRFPKINRSA